MLEGAPATESAAAPTPAASALPAPAKDESEPSKPSEGAEVVLKGQMHGDVFHTSEVMAKCPSKYAQEGVQKSAMVTRCSREGASAERMN